MIFASSHPSIAMASRYRRKGNGVVVKDHVVFFVNSRVVPSIELRGIVVSRDVEFILSIN